MKILFLSSVFPDAAAPSRGTYNLATCCALAREHEVHVISPRPWVDLIPDRLRGRKSMAPQSALVSGINVAYPISWYPPKILREHYGLFMWWSVRKAVENLARTFRPDVVLSYWAHPDGEAAVRTGRRLRVPAVVITGGSDVLLLPGHPARGERIRRVLTEAAAVLTVSNGVRSTVIDLGVSADRIHTVYQGVDPLVFHPGERERSRGHLGMIHPWMLDKRALLLWVGRMVDVKRLDVLIDSVAALHRQGRPVQLALIGDGPMRKSCERRVETLGLDKSVHFVGSQPPEMLGEWYRAADVTVLTSDSEGLPNVLRESMACRTPFVSTDVGSIRELADERHGRLVPAGDVSAFSSAVIAAIDEREPLAAREAPRTWDDRAAEIVRIARSCGAGEIEETPERPARQVVRS